MGTIQPRNHLGSKGMEGTEKGDHLFLWYGGSCSSKIVLTVSLSCLGLKGFYFSNMVMTLNVNATFDRTNMAKLQTQES